jgi:hypothetical protein
VSDDQFKASNYPLKVNRSKLQKLNVTSNGSRVDIRSASRIQTSSSADLGTMLVDDVDIEAREAREVSSVCYACQKDKNNDTMMMIMMMMMMMMMIK